MTPKLSAEEDCERSALWTFSFGKYFPLLNILTLFDSDSSEMSISLLLNADFTVFWWTEYLLSFVDEECFEFLKGLSVYVYFCLIFGWLFSFSYLLLVYLLVTLDDMLFEITLVLWVLVLPIGGGT